MPKLPEFTSKPLKGVNEEDWGKMTLGYFNKKDAQYAKTNYLRFKPELILELAEPFINAQQMIDFVGENQNDIRSAGRLIQYNKVERPEWFEPIYEGESLEECLIIARQYDDFGIFYNKEPIRVFMYAEISPIIQELSRIGISELNEINLITNLTDINEKLGRSPSSGDLISIYFFKKDKKVSQRFYTIVSASGSDLHLYRYIHLILNCEQTNMANIPSHIYNYQFKEY